MNQIRPEDYFHLKKITNTVHTEDLRYVVFLTSVPDRKVYRTNSDVVILDTETGMTNILERKKQITAMTASGNDVLIQYALAYRAKTARVCRYEVCTGKLKETYELEKGYTLKYIRNDQEWILSHTEDRHEEETKGKGIHILEEFPYWGDGRGYISGKRNGLYLYSVKDKTMEKLTGEVHVAASALTDNCLYYSGRVFDTVMGPAAELRAYDFKKKAATVILEDKQQRIDGIAAYGNDVFWLGSDMQKYGNHQLTDIWKNGKILLSCEEKYAFGKTLYCDMTAGGDPFFIAADSGLYLRVQEGTHTKVVRVDEEGMHVLADIEGNISGMDLAGNTLYVTAAVADEALCLYRIDETGMKKLYDPNQAFFRTHPVSKAEPLNVVDQRGDTVHGWVFKPFDFDETKQYPGLLMVHGGPRSCNGPMYTFQIQMFNALGYFVFTCNPHGSEGFGEKFADLRGQWGEIDFEDLMLFTDKVLEAYPNIDQTRTGMFGGSYGGFMANWIEGHTDRFAAVVSNASISNFFNDPMTSELGINFDFNELQTTCWDDPSEVWKHSPLKYADQAKTPILFLHGIEDHNCPLDQGLQMFGAMKYFNVPSRMVTFEGEWHTLLSAGSPEHKMVFLNEMISWFDQWLKASAE